LLYPRDPRPVIPRGDPRDPRPVIPCGDPRDPRPVILLLRSAWSATR